MPDPFEPLIKAMREAVDHIEYAHFPPAYDPNCSECVRLMARIKEIVNA